MDIHQEVVTRLAALDQRYTRGRRALVDVLASADRPLTVPEMIGPSMPQSSAYRNLSVLIEAGVVHRIAGADEFARFELAEDVAGHHHHLLCSSCGAVTDVAATPRLEKALTDAAAVAAEENGFEVTGHRIDLVGRCANCR